MSAAGILFILGITICADMWNDRVDYERRCNPDFKAHMEKMVRYEPPDIKVKLDKFKAEEEKLKKELENLRK